MPPKPKPQAASTKAAKGSSTSSPDFPQDLLDKFTRKLAESKLATAEMVEKHQLRLLTGKGVGELGISKAVAGFKIPYFDPHGKPTEFFRVRFLEDTRSGLLKYTTAKPQRYGQVSGTVNEAYLPPTVEWSKLLGSRDTIWITEGELKAACACAEGIPCIGLGGVWCFRSDRAGSLFLPSLEQFTWEGRQVVICYDSDASSNPQVLHAEDALCKELLHRGADPVVVRLPPKGALKMGLDDFLVERGLKALMELVETSATRYTEALELIGLNSEVVYVNDPGMVVKIGDKSFQRMYPDAFASHAYAHRTITKRTEGGKLVRTPIAKLWLNWPMRRTVQKLTYAPGKELEPTINGIPHLNTWQGWGVESVKGDVTPWHKIMAYFFPGMPKERKYFEQWLAYPIQHPGAKLYTYCVVWGRIQGTGKSLLGYSVRNIYGTNFSELDPSELSKDFNAWAANKQFVLGDEVTGGEGNRRNADRLKGLITRKTIRINEKNKPHVEVPDCLNYYFTSNHPDAFFLEDSDRRAFVHEAPNEPMPEEWYREYSAWVFSAEGSAALRHYLEQVDVSDFNPAAHAPMTEAKRAMMDDGQSDLGAWVRGIRDDPSTWLRVPGVGEIKHSLFSTTDLLNIYDPEQRKRVTANGMSRELKRAGAFNAGVHQTPSGKHTLWKLREIPKDMLRLSPGQVYTKERGLKGDPDAKKF